MSQRATRARKIGATLLASAVAASLSPLLAGPAAAAPPAAPSITAVCANADNVNPFTDLGSASGEALAAINCLTDLGIVNGTTATTFSPTGTLTRQQGAALIVRIADAKNASDAPGGVTLTDVPATGPDQFTDDEGSTLEDSINRLAAVGIIKGKTATLFDPTAPLTRGQFASLIDRMETYLVTGSVTGTSPWATTTDFFTDDTGSVHEGAINRVASKGVLVGDGNVTSGVNDPISRTQAALVVARVLAVNLASGLITVPPRTPVSNQTVPVSGTTEGRDVGAAGTRTCTVTSPAGSTVDLALFPSEDVRTAADGSITFSDADGNSQADNEGLTPTVIISSVNGAPTAAAEINNVASGGTVTVTLTASGADDVTLVAWRDQDGFNANTLDLAVAANTNPKAPREAFGAGCRTLFGTEALGGAFTVSVTTTDKATNLFTGAVPLFPAAPVTSNNFFYDANDAFQIGGVPQPAGDAGLVAFEARLSPNDTVAGTYAPDPAGVSTFNLTDSAPLAPVAADTLGSSGTTVVLNYTESATATADSYNIFRIIRPAGSLVCPDFNTAGATGRGLYPTAATATQADPTPSTAGATIRSFTDTGLAANTNFCYAVTTVDEGDESATGTQAAVLTSTVGAAPTITDVRARDLGTVGILDAGDLNQFIFNEEMNTSIDANGENYRVVDADGTVGDIICGLAGVPANSNATCALQGAGTFNGTALPTGRVLRVTITLTPPVIVGFAGTVPGLQYPVTITNVSAGWDDLGGAQLDLAGSADKIVNVDTITPA